MKLRVMLGGVPCGELAIDEHDRFSFCYLPDYVATSRHGLSVSMPIRAQSYPDRVAFPWFENLLPEGVLRHQIAEDLATDVQNIPGLLARLGGDVAGAVSLSVDGEPSADTGLMHAEPLDEQRLGQLLDESARHPFLAARVGGPRLSLAGAQQKLPVTLDGESLMLPVSTPSTHLLKPPSERFNALPQNEFLCMRAARIAGLEVADVMLRPYLTPEGKRKLCLQIARYDRFRAETGGAVRVHQEDICQAMSIVSSRKYEPDGGPSAADLFETVRRHSAMPARDIVELLKRVLFNLLIGNEGAHGKNFSLLYRGMKPVLSPAYDLVSTSLYPDLSGDFAMSLGGARCFEELDGRCFEVFGEQTGTAPARMRTLLSRFLKESLRAVELAAVDVEPWCDGDAAAIPGALVEQSRARYRLLERLVAGPR